MSGLSEAARRKHAELVVAANANESVQEYRQDPRWSVCWTEECIAKKPPMRVEFEHTIVFGTLTEAISIRKGKNSWGLLISIEPLRQEDFLHPCRIVYQLKSTNRMRQRWEWRNSMKSMLGKNRRLVNDAVRSTLTVFLKDITELEIRVLRNELDLEPREFWRRARFGDRYGPDAIHEFARRIEERRKGYRFNFEMEAGESSASAAL